MAETAFPDDHRAPFAARALAFSTAFFFCALTAGALVITVLGKVPRAQVALDLPAIAAPKAPAQRAAAPAMPAALASLPPGVTLGFAPYAGDVQHWVSQARQFGHEVVLEIPMEPFDFPDSDPGPHTLRAGVDEDSNLQRLTWSMSRFTGYAGVTNLLGQRFLSDSDALSPALTYLARRGLYFYDNGADAQSVAPQAASATAAPFAKTDETLDGIQTALEIDRRLSALEDEARAHGSAIGSGFLYPVTVDRIAAWSKGLSARGFVLVPVSAIVSAPKK